MTTSHVSSAPPRIDLRPRLLMVQDQGTRGTCLAFATTAAHEVRRSHPPAEVEDLAEEVLYWGCKQIDQDVTPGTSFQSASIALARWGQPLEHLWPYDLSRVDTDSTYRPPAAAIDPGACNMANLRRIAANTAAIKAVLIGEQIVMLGIQMSVPILHPVDGHIALPGPADMLAEGHAVLIVGYDDSGSGQGEWLIRNSWGEGWGDGGYGYLPYQYVDQYGGEAWIIA
ncbi:MAG: C1 family peptidase [Thermomicrobiales bacterium]